MNQKQWDHHENMYCERFAYNKSGRSACPVKATLHSNPNDTQALKLTRRLGHCSQFTPKPEPKKTKRQTRKKK